ncbi:hypothetical protein PG994_014945 [Apiospora phragmitis]|uniref:Uncharacterized protein n=1 Tax=Apiospora phragmitis TaxID=2905665 RepID=A0ABR1SXA8_9PEZI
MCVKNYVGYHCGHRDPEGTAMKTDYCRRPQRYDHEPACDVFTYRVHVRVDLRRPRDSDFCRACKEIRTALWQEWSDTYTRWNRERIVPTRDQLETHARIQDNFKHVELKARQAVTTQGPDHLVQEQYRERQDGILRALEQQAERVRAVNVEWGAKMTLAKRDGKVSKIKLDTLDIRRRVHHDLARPVAYSVNELLARQAELLDELKKEEEKADIIKEDHGSEQSEKLDRPAEKEEKFE